MQYAADKTSRSKNLNNFHHPTPQPILNTIINNRLLKTRQSYVCSKCNRVLNLTPIYKTAKSHNLDSLMNLNPF